MKLYLLHADSPAERLSRVARCRRKRRACGAFGPLAGLVYVPCDLATNPGELDEGNTLSESRSVGGAPGRAARSRYTYEGISIWHRYPRAVRTCKRQDA